VLLPTRNGGSFIGDCIRSVLEQEAPDFELIVSDNANTDETPRVLRSFRGDPRLKVVRLESPVPVTDNWNKALSASSGDYILMLGDDDCLLPGCLQRLSEAVDKHGDPDCITYNAYTFVTPHGFADSRCSYFSDRHYTFGPEFVGEGLIPPELRREIVRDMFRFKIRIPLNMQTTLVSRRTAMLVPGLFRPPFPDHYALSTLLLRVASWLYLPENLVIVGVSPKSFGHYFYSNRPEDGLAYLGIDSSFEDRLPGNELLNCMCIWLQLLKVDNPEVLKGIAVDRGAYVRRQAYYWLLHYHLGALSFSGVLERARLLAPRDWLRLAGSVFDRAGWRAIWRLLRRQGSAPIEPLWRGLRPLEHVTSIRDFAALVTGRSAVNDA